MRLYEIQTGSTSLEGLQPAERDAPEPGPTGVAIRVRAASLNARDQGIIGGRYRGGAVKRPTIPLSDGAGDVVAVGPEVRRFKVGDRVAATFMEGWLGGAKYLRDYVGRTRGHPLDGMLAEIRVIDQQWLVKIPDHLSFEEAATLPCAGVTAWYALMGKEPVMPGQTVLAIGTGGVAIFGLQIAKAAGARVAIISSSDAKLERAKALGADITLNYRTTPEWDKALLEATGGTGVDRVIEVGGETLPRTVETLALGGRVHLIGFVSGRETAIDLPTLVGKHATLESVLVGSRADFEAMNAAFALNGITPVVDRVFPFEEARAAYEYQASSALFGKVVIAI